MRALSLILLLGCDDVEAMFAVDGSTKPPPDAATAVTDSDAGDAAMIASDASPDAAASADSGSSEEDAAEEDAGEPDPGCVWDTDPFDLDLLRERVAFLASDALGGREPDTDGDRAARQLVEERFRCLGLTSIDPSGSYQQPFITSDGRSTANVVGYLPGTDRADEIIIVGAHHDHLGEIGGDIHNGANDNASGVAAVLSLAQALRQGAPTRRTIALITFGFEEHDGACEGSEHYAANAPPALPLEGVVYMLNLDMVGAYSSVSSLSAYGAFEGTSGRQALEALAGNHPGLAIVLDAEAEEDDSDFQAFCNAGIPYVYFETWDPTCYHEPCDDSDRIDYPHLAEISTLALELLRELDARSALTDRAQLGCIGP